MQRSRRKFLRSDAADTTTNGQSSCIKVNWAGYVAWRAYTSHSKDFLKRPSGPFFSPVYFCIGFGFVPDK